MVTRRLTKSGLSRRAIQIKVPYSPVASKIQTGNSTHYQESSLMASARSPQSQFTVAIDFNRTSSLNQQINLLDLKKLQNLETPFDILQH
jgi:hypothetical protein